MNPNSSISKYDLSRLNYGEPLRDNKKLGAIDSFDYYTHESETLPLTAKW